MSTLETVLMLLLVVDALALAVLVLLQQGKGADVGAAFGSGSAGTMFGSAGSASFFARVTAWLAVGFFVIAFGLAYTAKERAAAMGGLGIDLLDDAAVLPAIEEGSDIPPGAAADSEIPAAPVEGDEVPAIGAVEAEAVTEGAPDNQDPGVGAQGEQKNLPESLTPEADSVDSHTPES